MQMCLFVCFLCIHNGGWCHIIAYKNPCVKHCFCHVWCRFGGVVIQHLCVCIKGDSFGFPERWEYERFGHQSRC